MNKILFDLNLNGADARVTSTALWFENMTPPIDITSLVSTDANDYLFQLNGVSYAPQLVQDGDTRFKFAYRVDNVDTIMFEIIKETNLANIKIRTDKGLELTNHNNLKLILLNQKAPKTDEIIINLQNETIIKVVVTGKEVTTEVIK